MFGSSFLIQNIEELDEFEHNELKGPYQTERDAKEMEHVKQILLTQHKLDLLKEEYVKAHHSPETFSMRDIF